MSEGTRPARGALDTPVLVAPQGLRDQLPDQLAVTTVTLAELSAGLHTTDDPVVRAQRQIRLQWVDEARARPLWLGRAQSR
ncbi:hypothetical protein FHX37_4448 [Haloactinospora alba]|uniref:Uncharacterized protein n=1 Tax=Haloactinospora alba TaxID=405555 RepID=A0A543N7B8_9ACTN|nr:type II toxin-antitoxin system VapC family toxin [Haloactinospora alba]TQN27719.1 hypothetical protein FHX37_4448 [Haloactinospora alba]